MTIDNHIYDLIIIGAGPAGLSAGVYAGRAMVDTLIIEKGAVGGQVATTKEVVNYPGVVETTGPDLVGEMYKQIERFDVLRKTGTIERVELEGAIKKVHTKSMTYQARTVLIATGAQPRKIGFPGESEFTGRGIAYCATCDGEFYKGVPVLVVGGGYAAAEEAVFLTRFASEVHIIIRKGDFGCAASVAEAAKRHPKIKIHYHTEVKEVVGDQQVRKAVLVNNQTGEEWTFDTPGFGIFVLAGTVPQTELFKDIVELTPQGYIPVDHAMRTNIEGVYAAGDILPKQLRQIVTAVADGAVAATEIQHYVAGRRKEEGLPEISEEVVARQKTRLGAAQTEPVAEEANSQTASAPQGTWFDEAMASQLKGIFARLTKKVELALFLDEAQAKAGEMRSFMTELAALSTHITVKEYAMTAPEAESYGVTRHTCAVLVVDGKNTGIRFSGVPSGHEMNSFILALYNTAGPGQEVEPHLLERITKMGKVKFEICVSLSCHFCPDVVAACQRIASLHEGVEAEMIDAVLYPELKDKYNIMSFPTLVINGGEKLLYGAQTMEQILDAVQ